MNLPQTRTALADVLDWAPNMLFRLRREADGAMVFAESAGKLAEALRLNGEAPIGKTPYQIFGENVFKDAVINAFNGEAASFEFRYKRRYLACTLDPCGEGAVDSVVGTLVDVSDRRRNERKLLLLQHMFNSLGDVINIADAEDNLIYVNQAFCEIYGYTAAEVLNKPSSILWSKNNDPEMTAQILPQTLAGGWKGALFNRRKDGTDVMVILRTSVVRDDLGDIIGFVGIARPA